MRRVLVVEDEKESREFLKSTLESELFFVDTAADGERGSFIARTNDYDLIILDNVLPRKSGIEVCKEIRNSGKHIPILVLSVKSEIDEKTFFLDSGADDYLTKPYSHKELLARMRALLRRKGKLDSTSFTVDTITLNSATQEVTCKNKQVALTPKEFAILELLCKNRGAVVSRGAILEHVWDMNGDPFSKTVETHIVNLRKKIEKTKRKIILNVRGRGYKIAA